MDLLYHYVDSNFTILAGNASGGNVFSESTRANILVKKLVVNYRAVDAVNVLCINGIVTRLTMTLPTNRSGMERIPGWNSGLSAINVNCQGNDNLNIPVNFKIGAGDLVTINTTSNVTTAATNNISVTVIIGLGFVLVD